MRRKINTDPLRDTQLEPVTGHCDYCRRDYYDGEVGLCPDCMEKLAPYDERTVDDMFSAFDLAMKPYLSKDLSDTIHNAVSTRLNL